MERARPALFAVLTASAIVGAPAVRAADFYQGKTLTIVVGFTPGGGYDAYARLLQPYLGKYIPGHPSVIVENMPGAGSLTALRALQATQPQDGTYMNIFNPGLITQSMVQPNMVQLDFRKIAWVGVATPDFRVCYGFGAKAPKTWDEMMHMKQFVLGSTGKGSGNYVNEETLKVVFGAPIKEVLGFPGSADQRIAIEQGELDGDCGSFNSIPVEWVRDNKAHVFVRFTTERAAGVPAGAAFINDFTKNDDQRTLINFLDAANEVGRPFVMSNKVAPDRLAIVRKAFDDAMKDPALIAQAAKEQLDVKPISGQEAARIVSQELTKVSPDIVAKAKEIYE